MLLHAAVTGPETKQGLTSLIALFLCCFLCFFSCVCVCVCSCVFPSHAIPTVALSGSNWTRVGKAERTTAATIELLAVVGTAADRGLGPYRERLIGRSQKAPERLAALVGLGQRPDGRRRHPTCWNPREQFESPTTLSRAGQIRVKLIRASRGSDGIARCETGAFPLWAVIPISNCHSPQR